MSRCRRCEERLKKNQPPDDFDLLMYVTVAFFVAYSLLRLAWE
jgi:hypothetical protein